METPETVNLMKVFLMTCQNHLARLVREAIAASLIAFYWANLMKVFLMTCQNHLARLVREAIAANLIAFYWIQSAYNLSNMISKHWDHPTAYKMILKPLITRGNITLIPREVTQEKVVENLKIEKNENKRKNKNKFKKEND